MTRCPYEECDDSGFVIDLEARTTRACRCRPQRIAEAKARRLSAVIPRRFAEVSFDRPPVTQIAAHVVEEIRRYVAALDERLDCGRGIWLMGDVGTGKTSLAMLISKAALERGRSVAIYSLPKLLYELRKTYDDSSEMTYLGLVESLASVDLLHIDDVGAERSNEWVLEQLYTIINARYEEERSVIITTNLEPAELEQQITERTVSRLTEMCGDPLALFGEDQRKAVDLPSRRPVGGPLRYGEYPA